MFRSHQPTCVAILLAAAFLACSSAARAQRGGGGIGGGLAGGGGLSGGSGLASGLDTKDDLKGFHEVLALQATSQESADYLLMLKSTEVAVSTLQSFLQSAIQPNSIELKNHANALAQCIERARSANANFIEKLSDRQKSGLRDTIKRLTRTESELGQQSKAFDIAASDPRAAPEQIAYSGQNLQHTLSSFRSQQIGLGNEMSIGAQAGGSQARVDLLPVKATIDFHNQSVTVLASGYVFKDRQPPYPNAFSFEWTADLSDLQQNITDVLIGQLNRSDACGEQISIQTAALTPSSDASSSVSAQFHYERWACLSGHGISNEMAEGNGGIDVSLSPQLASDGTLQLSAATSRVDAEGMLGDLLRTGALGESLRGKIGEAILAAINRACDFETIFPSSSQARVKINRAEFQGTGSGRLSIVLAGEVIVPADKADSFLTSLKAAQARVPGELPASTR